MLITMALLAAVIVAAVGFVIFWANPSRSVNRAVCTCSLNLAIWLGCLHMARLAGPGGLFWLKMACATGGVMPLHFRIVQQVILLNEPFSWKKWLASSWAWLIASAALAIVPFTEWFIPPFSTDAARAYGWGYYGYIILDFGLYGILFTGAYRMVNRLTGSRRLELQLWLGGGSAMVIVLLALMALNAVTHDPSYIRIQPLFVLLFYGTTAYAVTTYRIFNARQIVLVALEKAILVGAVAATAYVLDKTLGMLVPELFAFLLTTALTLWFAVTLNVWLNTAFQFYPQATSARQAAFATAARESSVEKLEAAFLKTLKGWGHAEHALILAGANGTLKGCGLEIPHDGPVLHSLRQLRWATPERLARERSTTERAALRAFVSEHSLGVLVISEGATLTVVVGVGTGASRRPFTYPQVTQLTELASIVQSALERAHFSVKAQHAEQLATVGLLGASFAHEIRNPLVTIKTFVQLLPKHHQDPVFREKFFSLIGDEVSRIDRLTEQLLDLASPRKYQAQDIELHPILWTSLELVAAKATDKRIQFLNDFKASPDRVITDASATKQVLLNLCFNAIQAVETMQSEGERWVKVSTRNVTKGVEVTVEDSGPGISPEIRPRLFQPFQSTKSSGFGLGLAICGDILAGLDATIAVDPSEPGRGATFRIVFPCPA